MHAGSGSVHRAAWPTPDVYEAAAFKVAPELLTHAVEALAALRGIKSKAKVSMKTPILSVTLGVAGDVRESLSAAKPHAQGPSRTPQAANHAPQGIKQS